MGGVPGGEGAHLARRHRPRLTAREPIQGLGHCRVVIGVFIVMGHGDASSVAIHR
jgi:hypothetical protein